MEQLLYFQVCGMWSMPGSMCESTYGLLKFSASKTIKFPKDSSRANKASLSVI